MTANTDQMPRDTDGKLSAYAWPGGYPIVYVTDDAAILCPACANGENGSDSEPLSPENAGTGWGIEGHMIHWEGPPTMCDHCGVEVESAYGDHEAASEPEA